MDIFKLSDGYNLITEAGVVKYQSKRRGGLLGDTSSWPSKPSGELPASQNQSPPMKQNFTLEGGPVGGLMDKNVQKSKKPLPLLPENWKLTF